MTMQQMLKSRHLKSHIQTTKCAIKSEDNNTANDLPKTHKLNR